MWGSNLNNLAYGSIICASHGNGNNMLVAWVWEKKGIVDNAEDWDYLSSLHFREFK